VNGLYIPVCLHLTQMGTGSKGLMITNRETRSAKALPLSYRDVDGRSYRDMGCMSQHTTHRRIEMNDNNKSGYELRTDLLAMAIGIVSDKASREFDNEHMKPEGQRSAVNPYTTEDIITEAEKLYTFICRK
jgi:hypothetical protein